MEEKGGLYIHFPFCKRKCPYCHFYSIAGERKMFRKWLEGIVEEMKLYSEIKLKFDTIFIGGGSPSLLYPEDIHKIFESAKKYFDLDVIEFSMEVNPDIRDREIIKGWREAGLEE
jgi:Coproporphyrinogen III oxidase and related Fe-S oxidoreductases